MSSKKRNQIEIICSNTDNAHRKSKVVNKTKKNNSIHLKKQEYKIKFEN